MVDTRENMQWQLLVGSGVEWHHIERLVMAGTACSTKSRTVFGQPDESHRRSASRNGSELVFAANCGPLQADRLQNCDVLRSLTSNDGLLRRPRVAVPLDISGLEQHRPP